MNLKTVGPASAEHENINKLEDTNMDTDSSSELENSEKDDASECSDSDGVEIIKPGTESNVVNKIFNRQMYGKFAKNSRAKCEKIFNSIPERCCFNLSEIVPLNEETIHHVFMGFSQCGRFLLSYSTEQSLTGQGFSISHQYTLHVWSFIPKRPVKLVAEHRFFRHYKNLDLLDITMCQWPTDLEKLVVYGTCHSYESEAYLTIVTLPSMQKCKDCTVESSMKSSENSFLPLTTSQCLKHGVTVDAMLSIMPPYPKFKPNISLAYPDHVIINTGHYLYALNVSLQNDKNITNRQNCDMRKMETFASFVGSEHVAVPTQSSQHSFPDNVSDISESVSMKQELEFPNPCSDVISDLSDCETECSEYSKPFHELNISCEPLNVTGRSYWTSASVPEPSAAKPRVKMFLHKRELNIDKKSQEKTKIDIKNAEKAYEFTEENEKCEKLSLFRKKRLADKKYEFSEDNCENIVPFNLLRHERRFCGKGQNSKTVTRSNISPESGQFLSPRSSGIHSPRSPVMSPSFRTGPFSPSSSRYVYNRLVSPSPSNRKSPLSPRGELSQKYNIYSPSHIDSDYSDNDSKLVLRQINNITSPKVDLSDNFIRSEPSSDRVTHNSSTMGSTTDGLLIVGDKSKITSPKESFQWIKEVIRRYSSVDFESASSLVSDGQRDDYISVELPVLVHTTSSGEEHHLDVVPSHISDEIGTGITIIHRTFDAEQFCHRTAKRICTDHDLEFTFCADYDIEIIDICPLSGDVICSAYIEVGAITSVRGQPASRIYCLRFVFVWGAGRPGGGYCLILDSETTPVLRPLLEKCPETPAQTMNPLLRPVHFRKMRIMVHNSTRSVTSLRDEENFINILLDTESVDNPFHSHTEEMFYDSAFYTL